LSSDGVGLDWLVRVHALDPRVLEVVDMGELRRAVGLAVSELIRVVGANLERYSSGGPRFL
jgi:hypothetical protein